MESGIAIRETRFAGVFSDSQRIYTRNLTPGIRVYGERLIRINDEEYREWVAGRSKLAAYLKLGGNFFPFERTTRVLYLGAASGTTASHVSDLVIEGKVYCVEISPRSFRDLLFVCSSRKNMIPLLADASKPESYAMMIDRVDVVYQDIAQRGQTSIFIKNMRTFNAKAGMIAIKARSEDVTRKPKEIYDESIRKLESEGYEVADVIPLDPIEKDHAMIAVRGK